MSLRPVLSSLWRALRRPWLWHAAGLAAVAIIAWELNRIPLAALAPEARPRWPEGTPGVAAVVVSRPAIEAQRVAPPPFSQRDWSLAWINTVEQEIGPCGIVEAASLASAPLDSCGLLVITCSARGRLDPPAVARLEQWTAAGGGLVVELPGPELAALTGVGGVPERARLPEATLHRPFAPDPDFLPPRPGLDRLPLWTRLADGATRAPDTRLLASLAGRPAIVSRAHGDGIVVSTLCDFGLLLVATQQGLPAEDGTTHNRYVGRLADDLKTADLVPDAAWLDNDIPLADLLERAIVQQLRRRVPVPALWYWPDGAPGVYLMTHDDEARGARAEWMPADETARGVQSTIYAIATSTVGRPSRDSEALARLASQGHAVGLHWVLDRGGYTMRRQAGLPKLGPFLREVNLPEQTSRLASALAAPVRHCRLHYLLWDDDWARPFARLAAAGFELDSSYGPDFTCKGYLFGTGYPFHPLDQAGLPFALRELPYQHSEMEAGADAKWLEGLAAASRAGDHAALVSLFHPPFMAFAPSADTYRLWRALPGMMASAGHPALTMEEVRRHAAARAATRLVMSRLGPGRWRVAWEAPTDAAGLWLTLPAAIDGRALQIEADAGRETRTLASLGSTRWLAMPVEGVGSVTASFIPRVADGGR